MILLRALGRLQNALVSFKNSCASASLRTSLLLRVAPRGHHAVDRLQICHTDCVPPGLDHCRRAEDKVGLVTAKQVRDIAMPPEDDVSSAAGAIL